MSRRRDPPSVLILAAGAGRNPASPPPSLAVLEAGETLIERQVRVARSVFPRADVVVVVGHWADRVVGALPRGVRAVENERHAFSNAVRSLAIGLRAVDRDDVVVIHGDMLFNEDALRGLKGGGSRVVADRSGQVAADKVGLTVAGGWAVHFAYGLPAKWAQIARLSGREFEAFRGFVSHPSRKYFQTFEALNHVIDAGGVIRATEPRGLRVREFDGRFP